MYFILLVTKNSESNRYSLESYCIVMFEICALGELRTQAILRDDRRLDVFSLAHLKIKQIFKIHVIL